MPGVSSIVFAWVTGLAFGLLLSVPIGPVNLTVMNEGAREGFKRAALVGLGASVMEVIYCAIAFTGFAGFFAAGSMKTLMGVISFAFITGLGFYYLTRKTVPSAGGRLGNRIEQRFHPHSAFMTGFVRVMGNPNVLVFWIFLAGYFMAHSWVEPTWSSKIGCVFGVFCGTGSWFTGLSYAVSLGRSRFSDATLLRMQRGSGLGLLVLGLFHGFRIAAHLTKYYRS